MKRDWISNFDHHESINLADHSTTQTGTAVDCMGMLDLGAVIAIGPVTTADATHFITISFTECATSGGSYTAIPAAQITTIDSWDKIINATAEGGNIHWVQIELSPGMRYIKAIGTETATPVATYGVNIINMADRHQPQSS